MRELEGNLYNFDPPYSFDILGAVAVNGDGSVIVGWASYDGGGPSEAFVWDEGMVRNLRMVLTNDYRMDLHGWQLTEATAISADGSTIVGYGGCATGSGPWIAVIPEPAPLPVAGLAATLLLRRRNSCGGLDPNVYFSP